MSDIPDFRGLNAAELSDDQFAALTSIYRHGGKPQFHDVAVVQTSAAYKAAQDRQAAADAQAKADAKAAADRKTVEDLKDRLLQEYLAKQGAA